MPDDLIRQTAKCIAGARRRAGGQRVAEEDQRLLLQAQIRCVDGHLRGPRKTLEAVLSVDPADAGVQRGGTRRPDQPVVLVCVLENAIQFDRPVLGSIGAILGRSKGIVGDEHLALVAIKGPPELLRGRALVHLPALAELHKAEDARGCRLPHLGRAGQHGEPVTPHRLAATFVRRGRHEGRRECTRRLQIEVRRRERIPADEIVQLANAQKRRHRHP